MLFCTLLERHATSDLAGRKDDEALMQGTVCKDKDSYPQLRLYGKKAKWRPVGHMDQY